MNGILDLGMIKHWIYNTFTMRINVAWYEMVGLDMFHKIEI